MLDLQYQEQTLSQREYTDFEQNESVDLTTQSTMGWGKRTATTKHMAHPRATQLQQLRDRSQKSRGRHWHNRHQAH